MNHIYVGALVRLRNGRKARIYSLDAGGRYPVHGASYRPEDSQWLPETWTTEGVQVVSEPSSPYDIVGPWREPLTIKGWVNVYPSFAGSSLPINLYFALTREEADLCASKDRIACVYISGTEVQK